MDQAQVVIYEQRIDDAILDHPFGIPRVFARIVVVTDAPTDPMDMPDAA